jgi:uncharacterized membrane protein
MGALNPRVLSKMSDTVVLCEERAAWRDIEVQIRHGVAPQKSVSDRAATLSKERERRNLAPLPM